MVRIVGRSPWDVVGAYVTWLGFGLLGIVGLTVVLDAVGTIGRTAWMLLQPGLIGVGVGWALLSEGRFDLTPVRRMRADLYLAAATAVAALVTAVGGLAIVGLVGPGEESFMRRLWLPGLVMSLVAAAGVAAVAMRRSREPMPVATPSRPVWAPPVQRAIAISVLLAVLLGAALGAAAAKREHYPLSPFQMYSVVQRDPRIVEQRDLVAYTASGDMVPLASTIGNATIQRWLAQEPEALRRLVVGEFVEPYEAATGVDLVRAEVAVERYRVPPYPGPPDLELMVREVEVAIDGL